MAQLVVRNLEEDVKRRLQPDPAVVMWLDRQPSESVRTTAVTVFEIQFGISLLAPGRRRRQLKEASPVRWRRTWRTHAC